MRFEEADFFICMPQTNLEKNLMDVKALNIINSSEFKRLVKKRWKVSLLLTFLMCFLYFGFLILVAFKKEWLAIKLFDGLTLAVPLGIGILLFTWLITGWYVRWANHIYDKEVEALRQKL